MPALHMDLQEGQGGEELLARLALMELHICVLCLDVLSMSSGAGESFVTGAALQGGELGGAMILSCKDIRVVGPVVIP